jgi:hypothetical protein
MKLLPRGVRISTATRRCRKSITAHHHHRQRERIVGGMRIIIIGRYAIRGASDASQQGPFPAAGVLALARAGA